VVSTGSVAPRKAELGRADPISHPSWRPRPCGSYQLTAGNRGAWSSFWYNNFIYESEITKGLNVFRLSDRVTDGTIRLGRLNPQTQEFTIG
jgi:hypothetical protein